MAFLPVGVDENNKFPPAVQADLNATYGPISRSLPEGGSAGQVPVKTASGVAWQDAPSGGGTPTDTTTADVATVLGLRPKVSTTPPTLAWSTTQPVTDAARVAHDVSGVATAVRVIGGFAINPGDANGNRVRNGVNGNDRSPLILEFLFTGADLAYEIRADSGGVKYQLYVDGVPLTATPDTIRGVTETAGQAYYLRQTFPTAQPRRLRIVIDNADFRGIWKLAADSVTPTTDIVTLPKVAFVGDSWTQTALGLSTIQSPAYTAGRLLTVDAAMCGQGGTGYTKEHGTITNRKKFGDATRIADLVTWGAQFVVVFGSINDNSSTASVIQTAAAQMYADLKTNLPTVPVIVVGPQPVSGVPSAAVLANRDAVRTAALAATNVVAFIDPIELKMITGTGKSTARTGSGNADFFIGSDGVHPTALGSDWVGTWIASRIAPFIQGTV